MRCEEFESAVLERADGCVSGSDDAALDEHARGCASCRELWHGVALLPRAFAAAAVPAPSHEFTDGVVAAAVAEQRARLYWRRTIPRRLAAIAATLIFAAAGWAWYAGHQLREDRSQHVVVQPPAVAPADEELLFPEWNDPAAAHQQDTLALVAAAQPLAQALRELARSLEDPVRPIADVTSRVLETLLNDLPDPDMSDMPGMRNMMPGPMKKKAMEMRPSS